MASVTSTMLRLGTEAPAFDLPDTAGNRVSISDFQDAPALLVAFMCNHCPYVKHVREHFVELVKEYQDRGVAVVGINANDVDTYPDDSPEHMARDAQTYGYTFPYLYDESQTADSSTGGRWIPAGRAMRIPSPAKTCGPPWMPFWPESR
jgi:peroxiredoxin